MKLPLDRLKKLGKKALTGVICAVAAAALAIGALADSPDELFSGTSQSAQVIAVRCGRPWIPPSRKRSRPCATASAGSFSSQPSAVRGIVLLPLWAVGKGLLWLLDDAVYRDESLFCRLSSVC